MRVKLVRYRLDSSPSEYRVKKPDPPPDVSIVDQGSMSKYSQLADSAWSKPVLSVWALNYTLANTTSTNKKYRTKTNLMQKNHNTAQK